VLELAEVQIEQGKGREAWQTCGKLRPLLGPVEKDPILSAALIHLLRVEERGLSLAVVKKVRTAVERRSQRKDARERQVWRSLAIPRR
jgi:hypothetical protein